MRYDQQPQPGDDRPKLFMPPVHMHTHVPAHDYSHLMQHQQHPQQHQQQQHVVKYETGAHYYHPAPHAQPPMLHVSSSAYHAPADVSAASASTPPNAKKRSREDLNLKEKQRMFKLNERIAQLKTLLDDAGVQTKKSKQSILDNTVHLIEKLQSDLLIANQKAERAERQADGFRAQGRSAAAAKTDRLLRGCFEHSSTPRAVVDLSFKPVAFNGAFARFAGVAEPALKKKKTLRPYLCADKETLDSILAKTRDSKQSRSVLVKTGAKGAAVILVAAALTDDSGDVVNIEFSLVPMDAQQPQQPTAKRQTAGGEGGKKGAAGFDVQL
ncbi:DNA binding protein [Phytophthora cinnamomi]|uniref:DNA binding protein n=1 Tax=Phytophthora cinnamomi TaxID=4785 RepID=UPI00355A155A|nr:DNA binding protein [Phytophthora cinnamomi]